MNSFNAGFHKIQSRDNQKLKFARSVRDTRERDYIFVEGLRLCEEILKTELKVKFVLLTREFVNKNSSGNFVNDLISKKLEINEVDEKILDLLSDTKTSQGIVIIAEKPQTGKEIIENRLSTNPFLLLLHQVNNPSNLGAILRTAEAVGINGVITTKGTTDVFSPKSLRGAMGAGFRLPFWTNANFYDALQWAGEKNIKSVCADVKSEKSYTEIDWNEPKLLIFGSEGHGLTEAEMNSTDESLIIPMENSVESLNVAVACGVLLFEAKRQKDLSKN
jgi:RNA methyltransferase, TrmH family